MKTILVTGSSGTVGTAVCEKLLENNYTIYCIDSKNNKHSRQIDAITQLVDLTDRRAVFEQLPNDIDLIIHLAGCARVPHSTENPVLAKDNIEMTFNVLEFARKFGVKRILFSSSKDVYGNSKSFYAEDDVDLSACESPYGASKIACEALLHAYHKCYNISYMSVRLSNVYGRYDDPDRLIPIFIRLTQQNKNITVNGADKLLDFIYIDDLTAAIMLCIENFEKVKNRTFNIASGEGTPLLQIAEMIKNNLNGTKDIRVNKSNPGDVIKSVSDIARANKDLNYFPKVSIEEGIKKTINEHLRK